MTGGGRMDKHMLVTGGAGFIGSAFVRYARKEGRRVIVLDALTYAGNPDNLKEFIDERNLLLPVKGEKIKRVSFNLDGFVREYKPERVEEKLLSIKLRDYQVHRVDDVKKKLQELQEEEFIFVVGDICDKKLLHEILPFVETVVHFAAETHVDRSLLNPESFIYTDINGTFTLLEACRNEEIKRFVHVSTDEIYGEAPFGVFYDEESPLRPRNPYSAAKASADIIARSYFIAYGLPVVVVRPSNNYGPYQFPEKLIPLMTIRAINNEHLPIYGDGKQRRDWLWVYDTARGVMLAHDKGKDGEIYNLAGGEERENIEVVKRILEELGKPESLIRFVKDRPAHDRRYALNSEKAERELGWKPEKPFEEGLKETVRWYVENEPWWRRIMEENEEFRKFMEEWYRER